MKGKGITCSSAFIDVSMCMGWTSWQMICEYFDHGAAPAVPALASSLDSCATFYSVRAAMLFIDAH